MANSTWGGSALLLGRDTGGERTQTSGPRLCSEDEAFLTSSKLCSWPRLGYSWLSTTRPPHAYSCPSCQLLSLQEELIVQFPSPKLSSDAKQNTAIIATLLQGTVAYWKMLTWAKNSIHSLYVIRATQFDFHCCVFHSLLRGTIIWSTGCEELGNPRWSNGLWPLSPRWALDTMWLMPVAVGQLGIWLTPNTR